MQVFRFDTSNYTKELTKASIIIWCKQVQYLYYQRLKWSKYHNLERTSTITMDLIKASIIISDKQVQVQVQLPWT